MTHGVFGSPVAHIPNLALSIFSVKVVRHIKQILAVEKRREWPKIPAQAELGRAPGTRFATNLTHQRKPPSVSNIAVNKSQRFRVSRWSMFPPAVSALATASIIVALAIVAHDILPDARASGLALLLSPLILVSSAVLVRRHPATGHATAILGTILPLQWILRTESRAYRNSWVALNASSPETSVYVRYAELRILTVAVLLFTLIWAVTRLLPDAWQLRGRAINQRTWPAITISFLLIAWWFAAFVFPYRQPVIVDAATPELSILHVKKDGTVFHETRVTVYSDSTYFVVRSDRRLFRYSFAETGQSALLSDDLRARLSVVRAVPELKHTLAEAPRALRSQHGEGWYTEMGSFAITAFTTEDASPPPKELVAFFDDIEKAPTSGQSWHYEVRDVCLGFCYDPKAGLGYSAENQRCTYGFDNRERCY